MPDVDKIGKVLQVLLQQKKRLHKVHEVKQGKSSRVPDAGEMAERTDTGYLFLRDVEEYRSELSGWLQDPENNLTGRVTLNRVRTYLFHRLVAETGDLMAAVLITGHDHPQARSQKFYAVYSEERLQRTYTEVAELAFRLGRKAAGFSEPALSDEDNQRTGENNPRAGKWIGARLCAKRDEVVRAIRELRDGINSLHGFKDFKDFVRYHNLYTLYTVLMFAYATAMRAIRTPYIWLDKIDQETGFAFVSDKDDDAQHKTRLVWVPPFVVEQMRAYSDHLVALASDCPNMQVWDQPCCFLTVKGKPIEVRPKTLTEQMGPFLALPANHHRKFMRHELLSSFVNNSFCPPEVVNGWLGHAFRGEELWGPYSSFSYSEYKRILKIHLGAVLVGLGWKTIISPLPGFRSGSIGKH